MNGKLGTAQNWIKDVLSEIDKPEPNIEALKALRSKGIIAYLHLNDANHEIKNMYYTLLGSSDFK